MIESGWKTSALRPSTAHARTSDVERPRRHGRASGGCSGPRRTRLPKIVDEHHGRESLPILHVVGAEVGEADLALGGQVGEELLELRTHPPRPAVAQTTPLSGVRSRAAEGRRGAERQATSSRCAGAKGGGSPTFGPLEGPWKSWIGQPVWLCTLCTT